MLESTKVVNKYKQFYSIYIGRGSKWGNQFTHLKSNYSDITKVASREEAIEMHKAELLANPTMLKEVRSELKGEILGCFCKPKGCHGDTYAWICDMSKEDFNKLISID